MSLDWLKLRPWDGSQQKAFEKLCVQLLSREAVKGIFVPKAAPDAGVEAFWQFDSGPEWGIQAKFFLVTPGATQWAEIDNSVKRALERHPKLTRYTVAMPQDQADPRIPDQRWFADKWKERVVEWTAWTKTRRMSVKFDFWGETELLNRLTTTDNRGLVSFWFDKTLLTPDWMLQRVQETVKNVGPRYTPETHVDLPIAFAFEGLGHTELFQERLKDLKIDIEKKLRRAMSGPAIEKVPGRWNEMKSAVATVTGALMARLEPGAEFRAFSEIGKLAQDANEQIWSCSRSIEQHEAGKRSEKADQHHNQSMFEYETHALRELTYALDDLHQVARSQAASASDGKTLLIVGGPGTGKTHLLCDTALRRLEKGLPTLLLVGTQFEVGEPLAQLPSRILGLQMSRDDFLASLDAAGEAAGQRALILIDALNEGEGRLSWINFLGGMLEALSRYPHVGLAISVRDSYDDLVIPTNLSEAQLPRVVHHGFAGHEYTATRTYFEHYGLKTPTIPLLNPEFDNPLFLKLFCKSLENMGKTEIPRGLKGLASIFDNFLDSVNKKLSLPDVLDFHSGDRLVHKSVELLVDLMAVTGESALDRNTAKNKIEELLPRTGASRSLFHHLVSEDVIYEDRQYNYDTATSSEIVRFSFERFADHLMAKRFLDRLHSRDELNTAFANALMASNPAGDRNLRAKAGLLEALCIQVPIKFSAELVTVCPELKQHRLAAKAFLESIPWREPKTINDETRDVLNELLTAGQIRDSEILLVLLFVAVSPGHPWNADFLHKNLLRRRINLRDATWSIFVFDEYNEEFSLFERLINWAMSKPNAERFDDESVRLAGIILAWMFTTSHRFARDRATKALVSLLISHPNVLAKLLDLFETVDDLYVVERLYCVAYSCAMRFSDIEALRTLAEQTYRIIFARDEVIPHILLRDYARGVIEMAVAKGVRLSFNPSESRPPFNTSFTEPVFAEGELDSWSNWKTGPKEEWAKRRIYHSVMGSEDFARYVIGTNSGSFEWSSQRIPKKKSRRSKAFNYEKDSFDLNLAQRWIMRRVIDLGWKTELFGQFDSRVVDRGREEHKPERIGKKYQWIAYHEFLARVSDNFELIGDPWPKRIRKYDGPWQAGYIRDIDPSFLLRKKRAVKSATCWWQPLGYEWDRTLSHEQWLNTADDIPQFDSGLRVTDPTSQNWFVLEGYFHFNQPKTLQEEEERESSLPVRQIWTQVRSYLVRERDFNRLLEWAGKQDFTNRWMPESHDAGRLFVGEYYWSPAYQYFEQPYYDRLAWTRGRDHKQLPTPVLVTSDIYFWDKGLDCSIEDSISILLPCRAIAQGLTLNWNGVPGQYLSKETLCVQDPSVLDSGPPALLIKEDMLCKFLSEQRLCLMWTILGEKAVYEDDHRNWPGRLEISASYGLKNGKVIGTCRTKRIEGRKNG